MIVPDANLLVYAYDTTSPHHWESREWWESALSGDEPIGVPWVVLLAFTRILTNPVVATDPLSPNEVRVRVEQWLALDHVRLIHPGPEAPDRFFGFLEEAGQGANLTTDAVIATEAVENGAVIYSNDRDFDRFHGVQRVNPLSSP